MSQSINRATYPVVAQPAVEAGRAVVPQPSAPQGRSIVRPVLKALGWGVLLAVLLVGLLTFGGWLVLNNTIQDVLTVDTKTTVITGAAVVESIKRVNKQIFVEHYNAVDIDYSEAPDGWLQVFPIKQSFVVLLRGRVPAGFDLSQLSEKDVWVSADGRRVQLVLPPPIIFAENVSIDFENSRILSQSDTCPSFLCQETITAYQSQIVPQGRTLLIEASQRSGIMESVAADGQLFYEQLLKTLGFAEVRVFIKQ